MPTLHEEAIKWLVSRSENAINNHYARSPTRIGRAIPDIITDATYEEVEVVSDKERLGTAPLKKILWVVVPSVEVFDEIRILGRRLDESSFIWIGTTTVDCYGCKQKVKRVITLKLQLTDLQEEKTSLEHTIRKLKREREILFESLSDLEDQLEKLDRKLSSKQKPLRIKADFKRFWNWMKQRGLSLNELEEAIDLHDALRYKKEVKATVDWYKSHSEQYDYGWEKR